MQQMFEERLTLAENRLGELQSGQLELVSKQTTNMAELQDMVANFQRVRVDSLPRLSTEPGELAAIAEEDEAGEESLLGHYYHYGYSTTTVKLALFETVHQLIVGLLN